MRIVDRQIAHLHEQLEHIDTYDSVSYDSTQESIKRMKIVKASLPLL
ncbi:MAG: hypothetical protein H6766_01255 [Candidatus Peribacteria bacterium]|nr:MAG: hypothetical protein H6766_01255 [Candidatus Peribacteria bacterium]